MTRVGPMSEAAFQSQVIQLARTLGWDLIFHPRYSLGSEPGWPDLALARRRDGRFLLAELKSDKGQLSGRQTEVIDLLRRCHVRVEVWRPGDLQAVADVLR